MSADVMAVPADLPLARDDEAEFRALYVATFRKLSAYAASLVGDNERGADIAQESYVRLFSRWRKVDDHEGYLFVVASNLVRDHWRKRKREATVLRLIRTTATHEVAAHDPALRDAVERLPKHLCEVVLLHYYADLPLEAIAASLHRPLGTVKRQLHDARSRLSTTWRPTDDA